MKMTISKKQFDKKDFSTIAVTRDTGFSTIDWSPVSSDRQVPQRAALWWDYICIESFSCISTLVAVPIAALIVQSDGISNDWLHNTAITWTFPSLKDEWIIAI